MSPRRTFHNSPPKGNVMDQPPIDMAKAEFGRRLQHFLTEKGWSQSDLARAATKHMPAKKPFRRDNVSNYIRGLQVPTPVRMNAMCMALGVSQFDLVPTGAVRSVDSNAPPLEMRPVDGGNVFLRINQIMSQDMALKILALISKDQVS